jgi:hypothetical protein
VHFVLQLADGSILNVQTGFEATPADFGLLDGLEQGFESVVQGVCRRGSR